MNNIIHKSFICTIRNLLELVLICSWRFTFVFVFFPKKICFEMNETVDFEMFQDEILVNEKGR